LVVAVSGEDKKSAKRGIDDYGYPLGYNGWASSLKLNPVHSQPLIGKSNAFAPSLHDLNHLVAAAKQAAHDVFVAQQYVNSAKEDVLYVQKLVKEKEAQALIAHQKSEAAQHALRAEAHNFVVAQQKLAKVSSASSHANVILYNLPQAKAFAAELQLKQAVKDAEAARAIQSSANQAHGEIQKAEQAAKLSFFKQSIGPHKPGHAYPGLSPTAPTPWATAPYATKYI
jgi:hypothetical protein